MPNIFSLAQIEQLKNDAKRVARDRRVTHSRALDEIALKHGFENWSLLMKCSGNHEVSSPPPQRFHFDRQDEVWRNALRVFKGGDARKPELYLHLANVCSRFASPNNGVNFALEFMQSLLARPRYRVPADSQAYAEMRWWLPYCVHDIVDDSDSRLILNRHYKPIGLTSNNFVQYEQFPHLHVRFDVHDLRSFSLRNDGTGYLYDDATAPWHSRTDALNYVARLEALAHACAVSAKRKACRSWTYTQNSLYETLRPWARVPTWFTRHPTDERRMLKAVETLQIQREVPSIEDLRIALRQHREDNLDLLGGKASDDQLEHCLQRIVAMLG